MAEENIKETILTIVFVILSILATIFLVVGINEQTKSYEKTNKAEDIKMFETENEHYRDKTANNSKQIILEFDGNVSKTTNKAIMNYLSNVNGKLVSINTETTSENKLGGGGAIVAGGAVIPVTTTRREEKSKTIYVIQVPRNAKFSENLQERIDRYLIFRKP